MRKSRRNLIATALVIIVFVGMGWLALSGPPDPIYDGKRLRVWLQGYDNENGKQRLEAESAVRHIGTNAIPLLLDMLWARDSSIKSELFDFANWQEWVNIHHTTAETLNSRASAAFETLGASASNAVPELLKIYRQHTDQGSQWVVSDSLGSIGPAASNAIPLLLTRTTSADRYIQATAIHALGEIHSEPQTVVPVLIALLHDGDPDIPFGAAIALGKFGSNASPAVPLLIERFNKEPESRHKNDLREALKNIAPNAAAKAGVK